MFHSLITTGIMLVVFPHIHGTFHPHLNTDTGPKVPPQPLKSPQQKVRVVQQVRKNYVADEVVNAIREVITKDHLDPFIANILHKGENCSYAEIGRLSTIKRIGDATFQPTINTGMINASLQATLIMEDFPISMRVCFGHQPMTQLDAHLDRHSIDLKISMGREDGLCTLYINDISLQRLGSLQIKERKDLLDYSRYISDDFINQVFFNTIVKEVNEQLMAIAVRSLCGMDLCKMFYF